MKINVEIARQLSEMYYGNNWLDVSLKSTLADVSFSEATTISRASKNSIAAITSHIIYYLQYVHQKINGKDTEAVQEDSFDAKSLEGDVDWQAALKMLEDAVNNLTDSINAIDESKIFQPIKKQGSSQMKILLGVVEHCYYHLGQIVLIKNLLRASIPQIPS